MSVLDSSGKFRGTVGTDGTVGTVGTEQGERDPFRGLPLGFERFRFQFPIFSSG